MAVGENIKKIRKTKGLTQKQLGEKCGIDESNIRKYENGKQNPKIETIDKIASALGVPIIQIKEDITWGEFQNTSEAKRLDMEVSAYEGILAILKHIYGNVEEKDVQAEYGESLYYLIGNGKDSFVLYEGNIEKLLNYVTTTLPLMVNEMKDTQSEQAIIDSIKADLNSPEWIAKVEKYIAEQKEPPKE